DCRTAFGDDSALPTTELLNRLRGIPESGWDEFGPGGLTGKRLASLLREYGIRSTTSRFPGIGQAKGYQRADFVDAWRRYCPLPEAPSDGSGEGDPSHPYQASHRRSEAVRVGGWYGSIRTSETSVPGLTSENEDGTDGTVTPLRLVQGEA